MLDSPAAGAGWGVNVMQLTHMLTLGPVLCMCVMLYRV